MALNLLYNTSLLAIDDKPTFNKNIFDDAAKTLHDKGGYTSDLVAEKPVLRLINETNRILTDAYTKGITNSVIPPEMDYKLRNSLFVFSGFKTMHELKEASLLLRTADGTVKNFNTFLRDVQKINTSYNENYLRAEYNFAVSSSQMAARWADHSPDAMLQYRTSNDESVRDTHKPLHNITLPIADPFWDNYYAPNGWGCRCTVVEVRKSKYEKTPTKDAMKLGEAALSSQGKKGLIFKFNPGKHGTIFPEKHPYYCRQMGSCDKVNLAAKFKGNELCRGCKLLSEITAAKEEIKQLRIETRLWVKENLKNKKIYCEAINGDITFSARGIEELISKPHKYYKSKLLALKNIEELIINSKYIKSELDKKDNPMILKYHYLEISINNKPSYLNVRELKTGEYLLYAIKDGIK